MVDRKKLEQFLTDDDDPGPPSTPQLNPEDLQYAIFQFSIILLRELKNTMTNADARDSVTNFLRTLAEQLENQHQGDTHNAGPS